MKKLLLTAAVAFGFAASAQNVVTNVELGTPEPVSTDKLITLSQQLSKVQGGAVNYLYDYTGFVDGFYGSSLTLNTYIIPTFPDSSTVWVSSSGSNINTWNHAWGAVYDPSYYGWAPNDFAPGDVVSVDSVYFAGAYSVMTGLSGNADSVKISLIKGTAGATGSPFSGVYYNAGTFSLHDPTAQPAMTTLDYEGSTSHGAGVAGLPAASNAAEFYYAFDYTDSADAVFGVEITNFTLDGGEDLGVYIEYLPDGASTSDTVDMSTNTGDVNLFAPYVMIDEETNATGVFILDHDTTTQNCGVFVGPSTRYSEWSGGMSFLNDMTMPVASRSHYIYVKMSGTSTVDIDENAMASVNVFPNPSNGVFNVELNKTTDAVVTVVDVTGQVIYASNEAFVAGERFVLDLSNQAKGMYIISIKGEGVNTVERVTIK